jgi:hypothetical protein
MSGARPNRPCGGLGLGLTDGVWKMMQECWDSSDRRWTISCIVSYLESSVTPTAMAAGSDGRTEPESYPASAYEPESGGVPPSRRVGSCFQHFQSLRPSREEINRYRAICQLTAK